MLFIRSTFVLALLLACMLPASALAAATSSPYTVRLVGEHQGTKDSMLNLKSPMDVQQLKLEWKTDGMNIALHARNLPTSTDLYIWNLRTNVEAGVWSFTPLAPAFTLKAALPTKLPRGTYAIRAADAPHTVLYAQTASFSVNGKGDADTSYKRSQTATMRIFTKEKYVQRMDTTKKQALRKCHDARKDEDAGHVVCTWNESVL